MENYKKITLLSLIVFMTIATFCFYLFWSSRLKPYILFQKTRSQNMRIIGNSIALFNGKYDRLPISLEEVVKADFLPEKSKIYYCPVMHSSIFSKPLSYSECEFEITFEPNVVVVRIPEEAFEHAFYRRARENARKWEVSTNDKAYLENDYDR